MTQDEALRIYRMLPYRRSVERVDDPQEGLYFVCRYPQLPGLVADGDTRSEAVKNAELAFDEYVIVRFERNDLPAYPPGADRVLSATSAESHIRLKERKLNWTSLLPVRLIRLLSSGDSGPATSSGGDEAVLVGAADGETTFSGW